jgi:hypothetical protein
MLSGVELCNVYWRQKRPNSAEVLSPTSVSFLHSWPGCENFRIFLKPHALYDRKLRLDALYFISAYSDLKFCQSVLDFTVIWVLPHNFRNVSLFVCYLQSCPSAICFWDNQLVHKDVDVLRKPVSSLKLICGIFNQLIYVFPRI